MHARIQQGTETALKAKVAFLSRPETYGLPAGMVSCRETHMSFVFLAGARVYKLKKPVRFPYLDFSTLAKREAACRAELRLNCRLAPDIYLGVEPLVAHDDGFAIGGAGQPTDWLVVMTRLDERFMLDRMIAENRLTTNGLDRLCATLARFYRRAAPVALPFAVHMADWRRSLADNRRILLDARFRLPAGLVRRIDRAQRQFLDTHGQTIATRLRRRRIVDGHGDLRPEHIWLDDRVRIIDCLEFNARLRAGDPLDEIAFLSLECTRLGAPWAGAHLERRMQRLLHEAVPESLIAFYRCHRATLRARLAIAHLLEDHPRTPEKWPAQARAYLRLAAADARRLEHSPQKREPALRKRMR
jgi:aminoglycoside phosphotransferase family enzyme